MEAGWRLQLLGAPTLARGAERWVLPFERRCQLLVLLALAGGWMSRREAAAALWPDSPGPLAATQLLEADPWDESALLLQLRWRVRSGQADAALTGEELLHRVAAEAGIDHAPLAQDLRR